MSPKMLSYINRLFISSSRKVCCNVESLYIWYVNQLECKRNVECNSERFNRRILDSRNTDGHAEVHDNLQLSQNLISIGKVKNSQELVSR